MTVSRTTPLDTVIVIGGSIAGLLAAAATAPHARRVVVVERDELPVDPGPRPGTPHAAQSHMLLSSGREALERLLPGAVADLLAKGALSWDADTGARIYVGSSRLARSRGSAPALAVSRFLLEAYLRERARDLPNVTVLDRTDARGLQSDRPGIVTGVRIGRLGDATAEDGLRPHADGARDRGTAGQS